MQKYRNKKVILDGFKFDSKKEAKRYRELVLLQKANIISDLTLQPKFELQKKFTSNQGINYRSINYIADFSYIENGDKIVEDVKSPITAKNPDYRMKIKWLQFKYRDLIFREV